MTLKLAGVAKQIDGETHIHPTDLTFEAGSFNILLGTTLAGKTTLMQLMAGLERPTSGKVMVDGRDVTFDAVQKRNVSMVYQQFINYPNHTVFENIASPLKVAGVSVEEQKRRVGDMADMLKLSPMLDRKPSELSGGQQQRTAMARALVKDAGLVLLDEPLANLDFKLREELRDELPRLFADRECVVVYATTEPVEALLLGGTTAAIHEGRVVQFGPTGEIYRQPDSLLSAQVFSEPPLNTARAEKKGHRISIDGGLAWTASGPAADLDDGHYTFGIRPHHVVPSTSAADSVRATGDVRITELSGSESLIHFRMAGNEWISQATGIHPVEVGTEASFDLDTAKAMYFSESGALVADQNRSVN